MQGDLSDHPQSAAVPGSRQEAGGVAFEATDDLMPELAPDKQCEMLRENGERCTARKAKGTTYCVGHLRSLLKKAQAVRDAEDEVSSEDAE